MPRVISPDGVPINVPNTSSGSDLRKSFNLPPNKILTKVDKTGTETLIKEKDNISINEDDAFESTTTFSRGN